MAISYLFKPHKLTNLLAYKRHGNGNFVYKMADTKTGKQVGLMIARPEVVRDKYRRFSPNADVYSSFFINRLNSYVKNIGVGKAFINIAKKESVRTLCSGNVHLISKNTQNPKEAPHLFYKKLGFKCNKYNDKCNKYFDECIKENKPVDIKICGSEIPMYIEKCVVNQLEYTERMFWFKVRHPNWFDRL